MTSRTMHIIKSLYGNELYREKPPSIAARLLRRNKSPIHSYDDLRRHNERVIRLCEQRAELISRRKAIFVIGTAFIVVAHVVAVIYYNRLTRLEQDVLAADSNVESVLQRRQDIAINLTSAVREYAAHEQDILNHVSDTRLLLKKTNVSQPEKYSLPAEMPPKSGDGERSAIDSALALFAGNQQLPADTGLAGLMAIAEQYPNLKLSENFQNFMNAMVETEKDLCTARDNQSAVLNIYEKQLKTFPGQVFAKIYGFKDYPHFQADIDARLLDAGNGSAAALTKGP